MPRMLTLAVCTFVLAVPALRAQDKDTHDKLVQDTLKNIKDLTKVMKDVQNKDQIEKAKKDVEPICTRIADVSKRFKAAPQPTKEQEAELEKKYKAELDDAVKAFTTEFVRLTKSDYGQPLTQLIQQKAKLDAK